MRSVSMSQAVAWLASAGGGPLTARDVPVRYGSVRALTSALCHAERQGQVSRCAQARKPSTWSLVSGEDPLADAVAKLKVAQDGLQRFSKLKVSLEAMCSSQPCQI